MSKRRNPNRLAGLLQRFGFELTNENSIESSFTFTKPCPNELYEWISISFSGKNKEAAVCRIGTSVTRIVPLKHLTEKVLLLEIAGDQNRGWTIVESSVDLREWENAVVDVAPSRVQALTDELSEKLSSKTKSAKQAANHCLAKLLLPNRSFDDLWEFLERNANEEQKSIADRLASWPGVQQIIGAEQAYRIACLAVVMFIRESCPPNPANIDEMPLEDEQLMWQIQIVADKLLQMEN